MKKFTYLFMILTLFGSSVTSGSMFSLPDTMLSIDPATVVDPTDPVDTDPVGDKGGVVDTDPGKKDPIVPAGARDQDKSNDNTKGSSIPVLKRPKSKSGSGAVVVINPLSNQNESGKSDTDSTTDNKDVNATTDKKGPSIKSGASSSRLDDDQVKASFKCTEKFPKIYEIEIQLNQILQGLGQFKNNVFEPTRIGSSSQNDSNQGSLYYALSQRLIFFMTQIQGLNKKMVDLNVSKLGNVGVCQVVKGRIRTLQTNIQAADETVTNMQKEIQAIPVTTSKPKKMFKLKKKLK